jgi:hypothetical protein
MSSVSFKDAQTSTSDHEEMRRAFAVQTDDLVPTISKPPLKQLSETTATTACTNSMFAPSTQSSGENSIDLCPSPPALMISHDKVRNVEINDALGGGFTDEDSEQEDGFIVRTQARNSFPSRRAAKKRVKKVCYSA